MVVVPERKVIANVPECHYVTTVPELILINMLQKIRYRLVFNRSGRLNSRGEGLIQIECAQALRKIYFSTHTYVRPERFKHGQVVGDCADSLNYALYLMIQDIERVELEYIKQVSMLI